MRSVNSDRDDDDEDLPELDTPTLIDRPSARLDAHTLIDRPSARLDAPSAAVAMPPRTSAAIRDCFMEPSIEKPSDGFRSFRLTALGVANLARVRPRPTGVSSPGAPASTRFFTLKDVQAGVGDG